MIHMAPISKNAKIPSAWTLDEIKQLISVIDRSSPIGKRNYAMILIACVLGLRVGDIKDLRFSNFDWESKTLNIIQNKTHKPLTLPIPEPVGWAVIDYIQNGRPKYDGSDYKRQYNEIISGESKDGKCYPVVTLVIYFGKQDWNYGTDLYSCMDK